MSLFPAPQAPTYEELQMELSESQNQIKRLEEQLDDSEDAYEAILEKKTELEEQVFELPELYNMRSLAAELLTFLESDMTLEVPKNEKYIWNYISSSLKQAIKNTRP